MARLRRFIDVHTAATDKVENSRFNRSQVYKIEKVRFVKSGTSLCVLFCIKLLFLVAQG